MPWLHATRSGCSAGTRADGSSSSKELNAGEKPTSRRVETYLSNPVEGAVLALYAESPLRGATLAGLVGKHGQVLDYNVPKPNNLHRWVAGEFKRLDIKADADASRALVEIVGDDSMALSNEILKLGSWAGGEAVARADVERLAAPAPRVRSVGSDRRVGRARSAYSPRRV